MPSTASQLARALSLNCCERPESEFLMYMPAALRLLVEKVSVESTTESVASSWPKSACLAWSRVAVAWSRTVASGLRVFSSTCATCSIDMIAEK